MAEDVGQGFELPLLLFAGFRTLIDRLHTELADQGHPEVRPVHGFAMQAIGRDGATVSELGKRLGVSKQAAGKTVDRLEVLGYVAKVDDTADGRRKLIRLTPRGIDALARSATIFDELRRTWVAHLGEAQVRQLEDALRIMVPPDAFPLDMPGWLGY